MLFIGDVHIENTEDLDHYYWLIRNHEKSIQVGDFSIHEKIWQKLIPSTNHRILGGNHEFYPEYHKSPNSLGDYGNHEGIYFIRGAASVDKGRRLKRQSILSDEELAELKKGWFPDEELTDFQFYSAVSLYRETKPEIVVSHDCPQEVLCQFTDIEESSKTRNALDSLFSFHKPKMWVFGHHHQRVNLIHEGCNFICLDINQTMEV